MKKQWIILCILLLLVSCVPKENNDEVLVDSIEAEQEIENQKNAEEKDTEPLNGDGKIKLAIKSIDDIDKLISQMTLEEKAGQLIQAERGGISLEEIKTFNIGSILSGGGSVPAANTPIAWTTMYNKMQESASQSSSGIPIVYGIDAVHGNGNVKNVTVFPHNIGLGAANNPELMESIGRATAKEILATGLDWNFGPAVSCVQDIRWGRTYESYSEDVTRVASLVGPYITGLQDEGIMATTKHFIGDGQTTFGTGEGDNLLDRGDVTVGMEELLKVNLPAYEAAIKAGTKAIMASFNSIQGTKVHGDKEILTDLLRKQLGFEGLVVSDWEAIATIAPDLNSQVALAINAGVDLLMQPYNWKDVYMAIIINVKNGTISEERLNEAVRRNLIFKYEAGLFEENIIKTPGEIGTKANKEIAREAVAQSLVLLKNTGVLPLEKNMKIYLMGPASDNVGYQCGGWTANWQGDENPDLYGGTSLKDAFKQVLELGGGQLVTNPMDADVIVLAIGEKPYTEWYGDTDDLSINGPLSLQGNEGAILEAAKYNVPVVTVIIAGRPLLINDYLQDWDALVMAWLPGTEGLGLTDVLFGDKKFIGTLPVTWPLKNEQASDSLVMEGYDKLQHQFKYGFGLKY